MTTERELVEALWRLAAQAEQRGVRIVTAWGSPDHFATSTTDPTRIYRVTGFSCTCPGFVRWQRCQHHSRLLATLGWLLDVEDDPDDDPDPAAPAAALVTPGAGCLTCQGRGLEEVTRASGAIVRIPCPNCGRRETEVPLMVPASMAPAPWEDVSSVPSVEGVPSVPASDAVEPPAPLTLVPREERVAAMTGMIGAALERLANQLAAGYTEEFEAAMRFYGQFHQYSWHNVLLIMQQCPHASLVAGMRKWNELGHRIRKGERGLWIFAPVIRKELDAVSGEELEHVTGYRAVTVFDASQLADPDANPLPSLERSLPDDVEPLYREVKARIQEHGIAVEERPLPAGVQGASTGGRILLRPGLDSRSRLLTLLHEVCHEVAHAGVAQEEKPRQLRELEAEATAFTVGAILGIEHPFASDYLVGYQVTAEDLKASLAVIQRLVREVLAIVQPDDTGEEMPLAA